MDNNINKNKSAYFWITLLVVSLVFLIPLNIGNSYAIQSNTGTKGYQNNYETKETIESSCSIVPQTNPKDSLLLSIITLCLPGILEKIQELRQIKCDFAVCQYEAIKNGLSPEFCKKDKGYRECKFIVGEIFAIPPMSILENMRQIMANILANPVGMAYSVTVVAARKYAISCQGTCSSSYAWIPLTLLAVTDISSAVQTIKDLTSEAYNPFPQFESSCEKLEDIQKEMKEIIKEYTIYKNTTSSSSERYSTSVSANDVIEI